MNPRGGAGVGLEHLGTVRRTFLRVRRDHIYHLEQESLWEHSIFARLSDFLAQLLKNAQIRLRPRNGVAAVKYSPAAPCPDSERIV